MTPQSRSAPGAMKPLTTKNITSYWATILRFRSALAELSAGESLLLGSQGCTEKQGKTSVLDFSEGAPKATSHEAWEN